MTTSIRHRLCRALTLVETLVVLAIIAILLGILVPVIGSARRSAKVTVCAANLRQLAQAIHAYRADHRAYPPARPYPLPWQPAAEALPPLYDVLAHYLAPTNRVYRCPADEGQVFDCCSDAPAGKGISYTYVPESLRKRSASDPNWKGIVMYDTGIGPDKAIIRPPLHRNGSANVLLTDGSIRFESGNLPEK